MYKVKPIRELSKDVVDKYFDSSEESITLSAERKVQQKLLQNLDSQVQEVLRDICEERGIKFSDLEVETVQGGVERYSYKNITVLSVYPTTFSFENNKIKAEAKYFKH